MGSAPASRRKPAEAPPATSVRPERVLSASQARIAAREKQRRQRPPQVPAASSSATGGGEGSGEGGSGAGGSALETWLMQKALEVTMVLRTKVSSPAELEAMLGATARLVSWVGEMDALAAALGAERDAVFQCVLGQLNAHGQDFDSQAGSSHMPMHQAKVLDRSALLGDLDAALRAREGGRLGHLVSCADEMRRVLRIKVEDGNDLLMARGAIAELDAFASKLRACSAQTGEAEYALYRRMLL